MFGSAGDDLVCVGRGNFSVMILSDEKVLYPEFCFLSDLNFSDFLYQVIF